MQKRYRLAISKEWSSFQRPKEQWQLRHSSLKDWRSFSISPTFPCFSSGRLRCQGRSKSGIINHSAFSGTGRRTWNFKLTRQLNSTPIHFVFSLSWRRKMTTISSHLTGRSSNGHIVNFPLFHHCRNADTILRRWFPRRRPHSTQSIPLFAGILNDTTTIKGVLEASLQIGSDPGRWLAFHFWPRGINGAASEAIRNSSSFRWHCDTRHWEETSLGENRISHKILNTQQDTAHYFLSDSQPIQVERKPVSRCYWTTNGKCC